jgi:hypothetical protein
MKIFINLLPPSKKRDLQASIILAYAQTMVFIFFLVSVILSSTMLSLRLVLKAEADYLSRQSLTAASAESSDTMGGIKDINGFLHSIDTLQKDYTPWISVVTDITDLLPAGIRLDSLRADQANRVFMDGMATTRQDALALLKSLQNQPYLTDVHSPLSNILQRENVQFSFEMRYLPPDERDQKKTNGL